MIEGVSYDHPNGRYTVVKYDHHPHLMEIAFSWHEDLSTLAAQIDAMLARADSAARVAGVRLASRPFLELSPLDPAIVSPLPAFVALRHYRGLLLARRGLAATPHVNYAAVIAATQTHVGGLPLRAEPQLVSTLYREEPFWQPWAYSLTCPDAEARAAAMARRWVGYHTVFPDAPLVGFPPFQDFTWRAWCRALAASPLAGGPEDDFAAQTLLSHGHPPRSSWSDFFVCVRDLALVRPRFFGTVEFRGDPAQPSTEAIAAIVALRLAVATAVVSGMRRELPSFAAARETWRAQHGSPVALDPDDLAWAESALAVRGRDEGRFLAPLRAAANRERQGVAPCESVA